MRTGRSASAGLRRRRSGGHRTGHLHLARVEDVQPGAEDLKIVTLARSSRARSGAPEGAAVRDETGRTYAATTVTLPSLRLSALRLAVAMAASSGAGALVAAAVVGDATEPDAGDVAAVGDLGPDAVIFVAAPDGAVRGVHHPDRSPSAG